MATFTFCNYKSGSAVCGRAEGHRGPHAVWTNRDGTPHEGKAKLLSRADHIILVGLLAMGDSHSQALGHIEQAICQVLEVPFEGVGDSGHVGDQLWGTAGPNDVHDLLRKLGLEVEPV